MTPKSSVGSDLNLAATLVLTPLVVVCVPIAFFAMAIAIGLALKQRRRQNPGAAELEALRSTCSFGHAGSQSSLTVNDAGIVGADVPPVPRIPSVYLREGEQAPVKTAERRQTLVQPHFEQKSLDIRRMSALPQDDYRQRVTSVSSTLTAAPSSGALGGTKAPVSGTTTPKTVKPIGVVDSNRRFSSVAARRNDATVEEAQEELVLSPTHGIKVKVQSHPSSPYSPRDKRFSIHLSLNLPTSRPPERPRRPRAPHGSRPLQVLARGRKRLAMRKD